MLGLPCLLLVLVIEGALDEPGKLVVQELRLLQDVLGCRRRAVLELLDDDRCGELGEGAQDLAVVEVFGLAHQLVVALPGRDEPRRQVIFLVLLQLDLEVAEALHCSALGGGGSSSSSSSSSGGMSRTLAPAASATALMMSRTISCMSSGGRFILSICSRRTSWEVSPQSMCATSTETPSGERLAFALM